jgi:Predicted integral membrane protein (DUF2269)
MKLGIKKRRIMNTYNIVLFFHVSGAIGYFVGIGTWLFILVGPRRAQRVEQVRALINLIGLTGPFTGISVLLLLASGFYMALTAWNLQTSWILIALISLVLMASLGAALIEPRRRAIDRLAREAPDGPLPESLERRTHDPILLTALETVAALLLGMVFLMITKPELIGSLIVMIVALVLGMASCMLVSVTTRTWWQRETAHTNSERERVG